MTSEVTVVSPKKAKRRKRVTINVMKVLTRLQFDPLFQLLNHVYPQLRPADQAKVILAIMPYIAPKPEQFAPGSAPGRRSRNAPALQVAKPALTPEQLRALTKIAASPDPKEPE